MTTIGSDCSINDESTVICYKEKFYYRVCGLPVKDSINEVSFCVKRINHPGVLHEDYEGNVRGFSGPNSSTDVDISTITSPDAPMETNEQGGSQSKIPVRFDLIDANAMFKMAQVLDQGARKYGEDNWRKIPVNQHLNHLLMHVYAYLAGDKTDEHLSHILCRATFAQGVVLQID